MQNDNDLVLHIVNPASFDQKLRARLQKSVTKRSLFIVSVQKFPSFQRMFAKLSITYYLWPVNLSVCATTMLCVSAENPKHALLNDAWIRHTALVSVSLESSLLYLTDALH